MNIDSTASTGNTNSKFLFARTDTSTLGHWWWTVDRWLLTAVGMLIIIGIFLTFSASPAISERIGIGTYYFVKRQIVFLVASLFVMFFISLLNPKYIRRISAFVFLASIALMFAIPIIGTELNGAARWINIGGFSLQPSEFIKPTFAVIAAQIFATGCTSENFPSIWISSFLYALVAGLLLIQPDVGMTLVVSAVWGIQFFLAGLPMAMVVLMIVGGLSSIVGAYFVFPHVESRVDRFLDSETGANYQVQKALQAFNNGGLFGRGPGEGSVKEVLPDAHTDFILAVAGEEFGVILCLILVVLFAFILIRGFSIVFKETNLFIMLAVAGILSQIGLQAIINMASTLHLMPTKGMTLPFVSYGGSSYLSTAIGIGIVLALTKRRAGTGDFE